MSLGMRVLRGPDWDQNEADGGEGHLGTVVGVKAEEGTAEVVWDNGQVTMCRVGKEGKHDLRILDNAQAGVGHSGHGCGGCGKSCILGMRWSCATCTSSLHLCTLCYVTGLHDLSHDFRRVTRHGDEGVPVGRRSGARKLRVVGIFPGARVSRGRDWLAANADGGAGGVGTVVEVLSPKSGSARNAVKVNWDSGQSVQHRLGLHGKVDLVLVKESPAAPPVYLQHLPVLDVEQSLERTEEGQIRVGDRVEVRVDEDTLKQLQRRGSGWTVGLKTCIGKTGLVKNISDKGDLDVDFGGQKWRIHPDALKKTASGFSVGDSVRVLGDVERVRELQQDHGGWVEDMQTVLGAVGRVRKLSRNGDLNIRFGWRQWRFNPLCCQHAPEAKVEAEEHAPSPGGRGRREQLAELLTSHLPPELRDKVKVKVRGREQSYSPASSRLCKAVLTGDLAKVIGVLDKEPDLVDQPSGGIFPLHVAVDIGETGIAGLLLDRGARINSLDPRDETPLVRAVTKGHLEVTRLLLERGADVNASNEDGRTSLHKAASRGRADFCRLLLQHGASTNRKDVAGSPPTMAAMERSDHSDVIEVLLTAADLDLRVVSRSNVNALHFACHMGRPRCARLIVGKEPSLLRICVESDGWFPIHMACGKGFSEVVRVLLEAGSEVDVKNNRNITPLQIACSKGCLDIVRMLLDNGANIDAQDDDQMTPLHRAVYFGESTRRVEREEGRLAVAKLLLSRGASTSLRNRLGETAMEQALPRVRETIQRLLETGGNELGQPASKNKESWVNGVSNHSNAFTRAAAEQERPRPVPMTTTCRKCSSAEPRVIFLPCAHKVTCLSCAHAYSTCPQCQREIRAKIGTDGKKLPPT